MKMDKPENYLCIAAHQDDIEMIALHGISQCFRNGYRMANKNFHGATLVKPEKDYERRINEQEVAAVVGRYETIKNFEFDDLLEVRSRHDVVIVAVSRLVLKTRPRFIYTHSPFDIHGAHVGAMFCVVEAIKRAMRNSDWRPEKVYGVELWGSLDWLPEKFKETLILENCKRLSEDLLSSFESQNTDRDYTGGFFARTKSNGVFSFLKNGERSTPRTFAIDLMPLCKGMRIEDFIHVVVEESKNNIIGRITRVY